MKKKLFFVNGAAFPISNTSDQSLQELSKEHLSKIKGGEKLPIVKKPTIIIEDEIEM